jgi:hypothetical protein
MNQDNISPRDELESNILIEMGRIYATLFNQGNNEQDEVCGPFPFLGNSHWALIFSKKIQESSPKSASKDEKTFLMFAVTFSKKLSFLFNDRAKVRKLMLNISKN